MNLSMNPRTGKSEFFFFFGNGLFVVVETAYNSKVKLDRLAHCTHIPLVKMSKYDGKTSHFLSSFFYFYYCP